MRFLNFKRQPASLRRWPCCGCASVVFGLTITPVLVCGPPMVSDIGHCRESGTLIVWDASADAVVIAADSKIKKTIDRPEAGDSGLQCKIMELGPHLAFAVAGIVREDPSVDAFRQALGGTWAASEATRDIVAKHNAGGEDQIYAIANEFGAEYARVLTIIAEYDPSALIALNPTPSLLMNGETQGGNTAVLWGIDKSKQITIVKISLKQEAPMGSFSYSLAPHHPASVGDPIAATGSGAHFAGLAVSASQELQARSHNQRTLEDMTNFVKDWTTAAIAVAPIGSDFGGSVDIAVVSKNQDIAWVQQKPVCKTAKP
jgi:hypothetical protein